MSCKLEKENEWRRARVYMHVLGRFGNDAHENGRLKEMWAAHIYAHLDDKKAHHER